jgi:acetyl esterase/lipase
MPEMDVVAMRESAGGTVAAVSAVYGQHEAPVSAVCSGVITTAMLTQFAERPEEAPGEPPPHRPGLPEEVARPTTHLASDRSCITDPSSRRGPPKPRPQPLNPEVESPRRSLPGQHSSTH